MKRLAVAVASLACALIAGCATAPSADMQAKQAEINRTIPVCVDEADCKAKWESAQLWVVHHSGYKIQLATDVLIETYNSNEDACTLSSRCA